MFKCRSFFSVLSLQNFACRTFSKNSKNSHEKMAENFTCDNASTKNEFATQIFDYFLVVDFEATRDYKRQLDPEEIIEFPCLKIDAKNFEIQSTFHRYVRPVAHPKLTSYCTELTGITQGNFIFISILVLI